jgi:hypothetical protein
LCKVNIVENQINLQRNFRREVAGKNKTLKP